MPDNSVKFHIIYTDRYMLLSRQAFASWYDIQNAYTGYQTSLGPWSADEVIEYLQQEYPNLEPSAEQQLALCMSAMETVLSFNR